MVIDSYVHDCRNLIEHEGFRTIIWYTYTVDVFVQARTSLSSWSYGHFCAGNASTRRSIQKPPETETPHKRAKTPVLVPLRPVSSSHLNLTNAQQMEGTSFQKMSQWRGGWSKLVQCDPSEKGLNSEVVLPVQATTILPICTVFFSPSYPPPPPYPESWGHPLWAPLRTYFSGNHSVQPLHASERCPLCV